MKKTILPSAGVFGEEPELEDVQNETPETDEETTQQNEVL